jgi:hypothetical protein
MKALPLMMRDAARSSGRKRARAMLPKPSNFSGFVKELSHPTGGFELKVGSATALESRLERQEMLIQTLLILLLEKGVIGQDELREWMAYVDGLDGRMDGRLREAAEPKSCSKCGRMSPATAIRCQYCDTPFSATGVDPRHRREE